MPVTINEITIAAKDIIRVEMLDGEITYGQLVGPLPQPDPELYGQRVNPHTGKREWCQMVGIERKYLRFLDQPPDAFLNRAAASVARDWSITGPTTVTVAAVRRRSMPYQSGTMGAPGTGKWIRITRMRHHYDLALNGALAPGDYTIRPPAGTGLAPVKWTYNDRTTRCSAIRATQVGFRPGDPQKKGYLAYWSPGAPNGGAIDYRTYDHSVFHAINSANGIAYTGPIVLRTNPDTVDPTVANADIVDLSVPPKTITAITNSNPAVLTVPNHGFQNGQKKRLHGIGGMGQLESRLVTVTQDPSDPENKVSINFDTSRLGKHVPGTYLPGWDSLIRDTVNRNTAATYVFEMDIGDWTDAAPGTYRFYIPDLGVSDPFVVDEAAYLDAARKMSWGVYNEMNGMPLDGRGGFTRPQNFTDGINGWKIFWSALPCLCGTEATAGTTPRVYALMGGITWLTDERITGVAATVFSDAGDIDSLMDEHGLAQIMKLDLCHEKLNPAVRNNIPSDFPKATEYLDRAIYAGAEKLPGAVQEVIPYFDFYRRIQRPDGSTGSGIGISCPPSQSGGNISQNEASHITRGQVFVYAADHCSNFVAAAGFAKLAKQFKDAGLSALEKLYTDAAVAAFNWAEGIYQSHTGTREVRDAYYDRKLGMRRRFSPPHYNAMAKITSVNPFTDVATCAAGHYFKTGRKVCVRNGESKLPGGLAEGTVYFVNVSSPTALSFHANEADAQTGNNKVDISSFGNGEIAIAWDNAEYDSTMDSLQRLAEPRRALAMAALFHLTEDRKYGDPLRLRKFSVFADHEGSAAWDYYWTPGADPAIQTTILNGILGYSNHPNTGVSTRALHPDRPYQRIGTARIAFSETAAYLVRAHILQPSNPNHIKALRAHIDHVFGANQYGISSVRGLGARDTFGVLHDDSRAMGLPPPPGLPVYFYQSAYGAQLLVNNMSFWRDEPDAWTTNLPTGKFEHAFGLSKLVEPYWMGIPWHEQVVEEHLAIYNMEFRVVDTIIPLQIALAWLHGRDGNPAVALSEPKIRLRVKWGN